MLRTAVRRRSWKFSRGRRRNTGVAPCGGNHDRLSFTAKRRKSREGQPLSRCCLAALSMFACSQRMAPCPAVLGFASSEDDESDSKVHQSGDEGLTEAYAGDVAVNGARPGASPGGDVLLVRQKRGYCFLPKGKPRGIHLQVCGAAVRRSPTQVQIHGGCWAPFRLFSR
jgi:hypothetical protein